VYSEPATRRLDPVASHRHQSAALLPPPLDEFFSDYLSHTLYELVEALQADFVRWLVEYNTERPHQGYRNLGKRPIETILSYLESVRHEG
jgi:hypothetical protein